MAPKKTNKLPTGERPKQLSGLAYRTARDVGSASEGAAIAGRNRDFAKKQAAKKTSYSPKPMGLYEQGQTSRAAAKKQADKVTAKRLKATSYAPTPMTDKQKKAAALKGAKKQAGIGIKKDLTKIAGAAGKVAGKAAGIAKSKVKADIKAAKTVAKFTAKAAMAPTVGVTKVAKAGLKALAKEPRTKQMYRQVGKGDPLNKLKDIKKAKKK
jgi:hypothetical protein